MPVSIYEAGLYLALAEKHIRGTDVAIAIRPNTGAVFGVALNDALSANDSRSAIINLLQNANVRNSFIVTSALPREKCLGMATMQGSPTIIFDAPSGIGYYSGTPYARSAGLPGGGPAALNLPAIAGFANQNPGLRTRNAVTWHTARTQAAPAGGNEQTLWQGFTGAQRLRRCASPVLDLPNNANANGGNRNNSNLRHQIFMELAWAIVAQAFTSDRFAGYAGGHNIGCVLRGPNDEILGWGLNSGGIDSTFHGEVNLIQNYHRRSGGAAIPTGSWLYTTLEPCHMCSALFADSGIGLHSYYGQADPGIQNNALARAVRGNTQGPLNNPSATSIAIGAGYANGPITTFLASEEAEAILGEATENYFATLPLPHTHDRAIWEAGLRILYYVNSNVKTAWGYSPNWYDGVI